MDVQATKMMSIHLEPLLPATSIELDIQQGILVAALLGVGLLYRGTAHAHYAQVLLNEIGTYRTPHTSGGGVGGCCTVHMYTSGGGVGGCCTVAPRMRTTRRPCSTISVQSKYSTNRTTH